MKIGGLRAQLALWHAGLMGLTLLGLGGLTYALLFRVLYSRADQALLEHADTTARQMATTLYRLETAHDAGMAAPLPQFLANDLRTWGRYIQVVDPQGNIREKSDGLQTNPLPVLAPALRAGLAGRAHLETVHGLGEHPVRIATVPVRMGSRIPYLVQAGTSLEGVEAALQRARWILIGLTPGVFLLALGGNWLVVGRALRRVDSLTRTALDIQSTNLQRRLQHEGPEDEIGRLAQAFDQMIARLDRSFQQVRQFSADASHELKTPLTAIRGEAEVALMEEQDAAAYRRSLGSILESAERMSEIVDSLLLLARTDAGVELIRKEPVELPGLVLVAMESLEPLAARHGVRLDLAEVEDATVAGDALWLNQVVTNLLSNGIKYTPEGGCVTLSLRKHESKAILEVRDTGIGIPAEHLPHIFDRFYRVDKGRARAAGGTGLGLSITRWAVEAHEGAISCESRPGKGSTFRVEFPAVGIEAIDSGTTGD